VTLRKCGLNVSKCGSECLNSGGNICATIMLRILEHPTAIPRPISMILAYPALDFNFTSWMSPANLQVLRTEQSETQIPGIAHGKDHMRHKSPLSVVDDVDRKRSREKSWGAAISAKLPFASQIPRAMSTPWDAPEASDSEDDVEHARDADKPIRQRVKTPKEEREFVLPVEKPRKKAPIGTRLTMTSRVGYFQDRIISPSMVSEPSWTC